MYANQLKQLIKCDRKMSKIFGGILAKDKLPNNKPPPQQKTAYIVNTDESGGEGKHWILLYCVESGGGGSSLLYFIDPLGKQPYEYNSQFSKFCSKFHKIVTLKRPIQDNESQLCGLYVIYFLYHLVRGHDLNSIESHFYKLNVKKNDRIVFRFCWSMFRKCPGIAKALLLLYKSVHYLK